MAGGGLVVALLVLLWVSAFAGDDETSMTTTSEVLTASETTTPSSTEGETATSESGTTAEATTTSTTTTVTTTTSTTVATAEPLTLQQDGVGLVDFGAAPAAVIAAASAVLGPPDRDTGWVDSFSEFGTCPPPDVRGVQWGTDPSGSGHAFTLLFTKAPTTHMPGGGEHFFGYDYYGGDVDLSTPGGMTVGSSLSAGMAEYPGMEIHENPYDDTTGTWFVDDDESDDEFMWGRASGQTDSDLVTSILGGVTCGE